MEINHHLIDMGERIRTVRKQRGMNQIDFYRTIFPDKELEEENIKKKMNQVENGTLKRVNIDMLLRICEHFDVSLDYLFGFETEYRNYENKAASLYTGLSTEAVNQLHFWSKYKEKNKPLYPEGRTEAQKREYYTDLTRIDEAKWIFEIVNRLLEKKSEEEEKKGIADLSIFYDLYMMSLDAPDTVTGFDADVLNSAHSLEEKIAHTVRVSADVITFSDEMGEVHRIDIGEINQQVWKNRLMSDIEDFISGLKKKRQTSK